MTFCLSSLGFLPCGANMFGSSTLKEFPPLTLVSATHWDERRRGVHEKKTSRDNIMIYVVGNYNEDRFLCAKKT